MDTSKEYVNLNNEGRILGNKVRWKDHEKTFIVCINCGAEKRVFPRDLKRGKGKYCSQKCSNQFNGKKNSKLVHIKSSGYVYLKLYDHPNRSKQNLVAEHRVVVEKAIDRLLLKGAVVHHIDKNKQNNELSNLFLCRSSSEHNKVESLDPVFMKMLNMARYKYWGAFKKFDPTKDRQDQLQGMVPQNKFDSYWHSTFELVMWFMPQTSDMASGGKGYRIPNQFNSMEQLWLAFVMKEKFNKTWKDEEWKS